MTKKPATQTPRHMPLGRRNILIALAVLYIAAAALCAVNIIIGTQTSTTAIEKILLTYSLKNEGAQTLAQFDKNHPILGMFVSSPAQKELGLPSKEESDEALYSNVPHLLHAVRQDSSSAAWWSWSLLSLSLTYVTVVIALERSFTTRAVLFALTCVSFGFFWIGILAPAMIIWTAPSIPLESGKLEFVLQHEVRGIWAIIWELLTAGHGIIGGFLLLFSVITPLTKATLTVFITATDSRERNHKIGQFLHTIGKWSMADVFVAAVLLALYALKFQEATKSIPCLGLYYFIGYCLLSLTTTELLVHSAIAGDGKEDPKAPDYKVDNGVVCGLFVILVCFVLASSAYTYQQYTLNTKKPIAETGTPQKLNNADLVLPAHK
jgi:paraquat-inducible protein A